MKHGMFYIALLLIVNFNIKPCFSSNKFLSGIKMGINFNKFSSTEGNAKIKIAKYPEYGYPMGYMAGLSWEKRLTKHLSFMHEMFYEKDILEVTVYTGSEGILNQKIINRYIRFPCFLKYQMEWLVDPYIFTGINLGFLLKSKVKYFDFIYGSEGERNITDEMNRIDASIDFGFGMPMVIRGNLFFIEARYLIGLINNKNNYPLFETWKTHSIQIIMGLKLN